MQSESWEQKSDLRAFRYYSCVIGECCKNENFMKWYRQEENIEKLAAMKNMRLKKKRKTIHQTIYGCAVLKPTLKALSRLTFG